jgi:hypothetical protein
VSRAARKRMGIESESGTPSSFDMVLRDSRRMEEPEARSTSCGYVIMLLCHSVYLRVEGVTCDPSHSVSPIRCEHM